MSLTTRQRLAAALGSVAVVASATTRFDPALDAPPVGNPGDYVSQGDCLALSIMALDAFHARVDGQPSPYPRGSEPTIKATAGKLQSEIASEWDARSVNAGNPRRAWSDPSVGQAALDSISAGEPVILDFKARMPDGSQGNHALIAWGYEDGKFVLHDPDFPSERHTLEWDPQTGFGRFSQKGKVYGEPLAGTIRSPSEFEAASRLPALRKACDALEASCMERYRPTSVTARVEGDSIVVTGKVGPVPAGLTPKNDGFFVSASVRVNRVPLEGALVLPDGTFRAKVPASRLGGQPGIVEVEIRRSDGGLVGIGRTTVAPPSRTKGVARAVGG